MGDSLSYLDSISWFYIVRRNILFTRLRIWEKLLNKEFGKISVLK